MNDELRSAAEDVLRHTFYDSSGVGMKAQSVAESYLAEHPADDDERVMPEWLESLGYRDSMAMRYEKRYELCNGIRIVFFARQYPQRWAADIRAGGGRCYVKNDPTRGDVRRLLAALGIKVSNG